MRILITGAFGYVGSRLVQELALHKTSLTPILLSSLDSARHSAHQLTPTFAGPLEDAPWESLLNGTDVVIHLAGTSNSSESFQKENEMDRILENTRQVAYVCAQYRVPLLFLSSSSLYPPSAVPYDDGSLLERLTPPTPYAVTKWEEEKEITRLGQDKNLHYTILRCASVFGPSPRMRYHTALNKFCWQVNHGESLSVWKTARFQSKPYLEMSDLISTIMYFLLNQTFEKRCHNVFSFHARMDEILVALKSIAGQVPIDWIDSPAMTRGSLWLKRTELDKAGLNFRTSLTRGLSATLEKISEEQGSLVPIAARPLTLKQSQ